MIKQTMIKPVLLTSLLLLSSSVTFAQDTSDYIFDEQKSQAELDKQETKGILGGALLGGVIAGPPGAIVVAAFGGFIANNIHAKKENDLLLSSLSQSQTQLVALQEQQEALVIKYQLALAENQSLGFIATSYSEVVDEAKCCTDSALAIHFKSNSDQIEEHYANQLQSIANLANTTPDAIIEVTGFADQRGSDSENYILSQRRVDAIQAVLISLGADGQSMQTNAYGESQLLSTTDSFEDDFFDRRVNIRIRSVNNDLLTQNK